MSFIDDEPPKHLDAYSLRHPEMAFINVQKKFNLLTKSLRRRNVFFTLEEITVLIYHRDLNYFPSPSFGMNLSKKEYNEAVKLKEKAQKYLSEQKAETQELNKSQLED